MKTKTFLLLILTAVASTALLLPVEAEAVLLRPFGGRVVSTFIPNVVCPGEGPIIVVPAGTSPAGFYAVTPATQRKQFYTPQIGGWILGLHAPVIAPVCFIPTPFGPVPIPAFPIILFGASSLSL